MTRAEHLNAALSDICRQIIYEWELSLAEIADLAADIPGECEAMNEEAWQRQQERGSSDDTAYRRDVLAAGRGHLLGDR